MKDDYEKEDGDKGILVDTVTLTLCKRCRNKRDMNCPECGGSGISKAERPEDFPKPISARIDIVHPDLKDKLPPAALLLISHFCPTLGAKATLGAKPR